MMKLSKLSAPAIAGVVRAATPMAAKAQIKNCTFGGADMIDLHVSYFEDDSVEGLADIISASSLPVLALNYNFTTDPKGRGYDEDERTASLLRAIKAGAAGVDIQGYTFHLPSKDGFCGEDKYSFTKGGPKEVVTDEAIISKQCEFIETVHGMGAEVLLSCHPGIAMNSTQIVELALFFEKRMPDIIKIVTVAESEDDMLESIRAMLLLKKEVKTPVSYHAGGKFGALTRVVNPALGGQMAFCVDRFDENATLEQLHLATAKSVIDGLKKIL